MLSIDQTGPIHVDSILYMDQLPKECVEDCGKGPGPKDAPVAYWRERLQFTVDRAKAIKCLEGYGAWDMEALEADSDETLAGRILWLACGDFAEWDGTNDSPSGSDIFVLE